MPTQSEILSGCPRVRILSGVQSLSQCGRRTCVLMPKLGSSRMWHCNSFQCFSHEILTALYETGYDVILDPKDYCTYVTFGLWLTVTSPLPPRTVHKVQLESTEGVIAGGQ
jgi:hypothetical protein